MYLTSNYEFWENTCVCFAYISRSGIIKKLVTGYNFGVHSLLTAFIIMNEVDRNKRLYK